MHWLQVGAKGTGCRLQMAVNVAADDATAAVLVKVTATLAATGEKKEVEIIETMHFSEC